jgi:hypothetical protein
MRFDIPHLSYLHECFKQARDYCEENGEELQPPELDEAELNELSLGESDFSTRLIGLPPPLRNIRLATVSQAGHFTAEMIITAKGKSCFKGISPRFKEAIPKVWERSIGEEKSEFPLRSVPLDGSGEGYILLGETPVISITKQTKELCRHISLGDCGAEPRPVEDSYTEFSEWMNLLRSVGTAYIGAIYQQRATKLDDAFRELPLSLDCVV